MVHVLVGEVCISFSKLQTIHCKTNFSQHFLNLEFRCVNFQVSRITMPSGRRFTYQYDQQGGLKQITLPSETMHTFSAQQSFGFVRLSYKPPGSQRLYLQHFSHSGKLLQTVLPGEGARILYRYDNSGRLSEVSKHIRVNKNLHATQNS